MYKSNLCLPIKQVFDDLFFVYYEKNNVRGSCSVSASAIMKQLSITAMKDSAHKQEAQKYENEHIDHSYLHGTGLDTFN